MVLHRISLKRTALLCFTLGAARVRQQFLEQGLGEASVSVPAHSPVVVQSAWLLLAHCASARANHTQMRRSRGSGTVRKEFTCLCQILQVDPAAIDAETRDSATLPMSLGGLGIRSAVRSCKAAHWASWADSLPMTFERHPHVANIMVEQLEHPRSPCFEAWLSFEGPHWGGKVRAPILEQVGDGRPELREPRGLRTWQHQMGGTRPRRVSNSPSSKQER